jgi:shikimate kinase
MDTEIEKQVGVSIPRIFSEKGEIYFRKIENEVLKKILSEPASFVLATGGGTPCYGDSMNFITEQQDVMSIYLKTPLSTLVSRLFLEKEKRPLLAHLKTEEDLDDFIRKHLFERAPYYNQANIIIENGSENIDEIVEKIISKLF